MSSKYRQRSKDKSFLLLPQRESSKTKTDDEEREPRPDHAVRSPEPAAAAAAAVPAAASLAPDIRTMGAKVRERLQAEREKRPEIVRITGVPSDQPEPLPEVKDRARKKKSSTPTQVSRSCRNKRKRQSARRQSRRLNREQENVDRWVPDVSQLAMPPQEGPSVKSVRSSFVWLHGLPNPCTPGMIRRFFSGLDPQRILILPRNPLVIPEWDAAHSSSTSLARKHPTVERYEPHRHVRVLAQFANAPTAILAAERSREVLSLSFSSAKSSALDPTATTANDNNKDDDSTTIKGVAIAVTLVPKTFARVLQHLGIDGQVASVPLHVTEAKVRSELDPIVLQILWTVTLRDLVDMTPNEIEESLDEANNDSTNSLWYPHLSWERPSRRIQSDRQYSSTKQQREALQRDHDRLFYQQPFLVQDPELLRIDPVVRLMWRAIALLQKEVEHCDRLLLQWRLRHLLNEPSRKAVAAHADGA